MKYCIILLALLVTTVTHASSDTCIIDAPVPANINDADAFIEISKQFLNCIGDGESKVIKFAQYSPESNFLPDDELSKSTANIIWLRRNPDRKDRKRAGMQRGEKLLGITYHKPGTAISLIVAATPYSHDSHVTLGHEVLHCFLGKFHK